MPSGMRTVAALGVALLAMSFVAEGSSARTEFTTEASLQGKKFVSKKYGYEFVFPAEDYAAFYAHMAWNLKIFPAGDTGLVDVVVYANPLDRKFVAAATRLPTGMTLRKFEASYLALLQEGGTCKKLRALRNTTLGGVAAHEFTIRCPSTTSSPSSRSTAAADTSSSFSRRTTSPQRPTNASSTLVGAPSGSHRTRAGLPGVEQRVDDRSSELPSLGPQASQIFLFEAGPSAKSSVPREKVAG
jgi:hypothetical protein